MVAQLGFTSNELKEFEKRTFTPGIDMTLQNYSYNLRWKHQFNENVEWISGTQGMFQSNTNGYNDIIEILIEDAKFSDLGAFSLLKEIISCGTSKLEYDMIKGVSLRPIL